MDLSCDIPRVKPNDFPDPLVDITPGPNAGPQTAVLAGGCFWCVEAVYKEIDGVLDAENDIGDGTIVYNADASVDDISIGAASNSGGYWFRGRIDDVRIYDRALPESELQ